MNIPCSNCGLVYDLSIYKSGQRLRCRCGSIMHAPNTKNISSIKMARTLHCSSCGGALEKGRPKCPFCDALIDLTDAALVSYCPLCLSMNKEGAEYCSDCGNPIRRNISDTPTEAAESCPRCNIKMRLRNVGDRRPLECPMCLGLFVHGKDFNKIVANLEDQLDAEEGMSFDRVEQSTLSSEKVAYIKCPVCKKIMNRVNYGRISGVIVDYCKEHGYWLDAGELEKIAKWISTGGLNLSREKTLQELKSNHSRLSATAMASAQDTSTTFGHRHVMGVDLGASIFEVVLRFCGK